MARHDWICPCDGNRHYDMERDHGLEYPQGNIHKDDIAVTPNICFQNLAFLIPQDTRNALLRALYPKKYKKICDKLHSTGEYSYAPFVKNNCIFVHIPKTGGVSISKTLFGGLAGGHDSVAAYQCAFTRRKFESMFKFSFVRNPWSRLYSAYRFLRGGGMNERDAIWAEENLQRYASFNEFVELGLGHGKSMDYMHFKSQISFLRTPIRNKFEVNFIGLFENIRDDFQYVCRQVGREGIELPHLNRTQHANIEDYRYAYSARSKAIVETIYGEDIDTFGYDFEGRNVPHQVTNRKLNIYGRVSIFD